MSELAQKKCVPCQGGVPPLKGEDLNKLAQQLGGDWEILKEHHLEKFTYISSEILGRSYGVSKLPYAVLIDEQGKIASMGIINSREHLESLFE